VRLPSGVPYATVIPAVNPYSADTKKPPRQGGPDEAMITYLMPQYLLWPLLELLVPKDGEVDDRLRHQGVIDHPVPVRGGEGHEGVAAELAKVP
jgi:hypothetical protein